MNLTPSFEFRSIIKGKVINVVSGSKDDQPIILQFFGQDPLSGKLQIVDVKVKGTTSDDVPKLENFLNKDVLLDNVKVFSGDYGAKFYRIDDISQIIADEKEVKKV